jgi:hypothetical protein
MSRWYQNGLTGAQVEVKTFEEEDRYLDTPPWSRIPAPPEAVKAADPEPAPKPAAKTRAKKV